MYLTLRQASNLVSDKPGRCTMTHFIDVVAHPAAMKNVTHFAKGGPPAVHKVN
jgi:hypothetical protein